MRNFFDKDYKSVRFDLEFNTLYIDENSSVGIFNLSQIAFSKGYYTQFFKGSRGYGKTQWAIEQQFKEMVMDENYSVFNIATTKNEHSDKLMKEWTDFLMSAGLVQDVHFRIIDTQSIKRIFLFINGRNQQVRFIGLDETATAGTGRPDGPTSYFGFVYYDEITNAIEKNVVDFEDKRKKVKDGNRHFLGTLIRQLPKDNSKYIKTLFTFNAPNKLDPLLDEFHNEEIGGFDDDYEKLYGVGFQYSYSNEKAKRKMFFLAGNFFINHLLSSQAKEVYTEYKDDFEYWKVMGIGMSGEPSDSYLRKLLRVVKSYQHFGFDIDYKKFNRFTFGLDVGNGNSPSALTLWGFNYFDKSWWLLRELEINKKNSIKQYNPDETTLGIIKKMKQWSEEIFSMRNNVIPCRVDNDRNFISLMMNSYNTFLLQSDGLPFTIEFENVKEKYQQKRFGRKLRPILWEYSLSGGRIKIFERLTPLTWRQLFSATLERNGEFSKGDDHNRESAEIGIYNVLQYESERVKELGISINEIKV